MQQTVNQAYRDYRKQQRTAHRRTVAKGIVAMAAFAIGMLAVAAFAQEKPDFSMWSTEQRLQSVEQQLADVSQQLKAMNAAMAEYRATRDELKALENRVQSLAENQVAADRYIQSTLTANRQYQPVAAGLPQTRPDGCTCAPGTCIPGVTCALDCQCQCSPLQPVSMQPTQPAVYSEPQTIYRQSSMPYGSSGSVPVQTPWGTANVPMDGTPVVVSYSEGNDRPLNTTARSYQPMRTGPVRQFMRRVVGAGPYCATCGG